MFDSTLSFSIKIPHKFQYEIIQYSYIFMILTPHQVNFYILRVYNNHLEKMNALFI